MDDLSNLTKAQLLRRLGVNARARAEARKAFDAADLKGLANMRITTASLEDLRDERQSCLAEFERRRLPPLPPIEGHDLARRLPGSLQLPPSRSGGVPPAKRNLW